MGTWRNIPHDLTSHSGAALPQARALTRIEFSRIVQIKTRLHINMKRITTIGPRLLAVVSVVVLLVGLLVLPTPSFATSGDAVALPETHCAEGSHCAADAPDGCCQGHVCGSDLSGLVSGSMALDRARAASVILAPTQALGIRLERDPPPPRPLS